METYRTSVLADVAEFDAVTAFVVGRMRSIGVDEQIDDCRGWEHLDDVAFGLIDQMNLTSEGGRMVLDLNLDLEVAEPGTCRHCGRLGCGKMSIPTMDWCLERKRGLPWVGTWDPIKAHAESRAPSRGVLVLDWQLQPWEIEWADDSHDGGEPCMKIGCQVCRPE